MSMYFKQLPKGIESIHALLDAAKVDIEKITIRPSGVMEFATNPLSWACRQILDVTFGSNDNTVVGSALHKASDAIFQDKLSGKFIGDRKKALIEAAGTVKKEYKFIDDSKQSTFALYKEAKRLFDVYYKYAQTCDPIVSEFKVSYTDPELPWVDFMGTLDRIEKVGDEHVLVDIKTSKQNIYGEKIECPELDKLLSDRKELEKGRNEKFGRLTYFFSLFGLSFLL